MRVAALAVLLALVSPAVADDGEMKAEIQEVLVQRHPMDTDAWWRALGPDAPGVIIGMYKESGNMLHKLHLLQGLAAFHDDPQAAEFLKGESKSQTSVIRGTALGALGASQGEKALDTLAEGLKNEDPQTRFAAAKAIHRIGSVSATEVLNAYLKTEKTAWIGHQIQGDEKPQGLKPVAPPSADARPEDFIGNWKGYWISPNGAAKPALASSAATASLRIFGKDREVDGEIFVGTRTLALRPAKLQAGRWQGKVQQTLPADAIAVPNAGEIQLQKFKTGWTLVLRIPATGETAVLLKN